MRFFDIVELTPWGTTVDLLKIGQLSEGGLVAQRNVDEAVVDESRHGGDGGGLSSANFREGGGTSRSSHGKIGGGFSWLLGLSLGTSNHMFLGGSG